MCASTALEVVTREATRCIAVVSDGSSSSATCGPVDRNVIVARLEARAAWFQEFAGITAVPVFAECRNIERAVDEIVTAVDGYRGVFLADVASPRSLVLGKRLGRRLDRPVIDETQEPAAIVVLAAILNALALVKKAVRHVKVVVAGSDATQVAIANLLHAYGVDVVLVVSPSVARLQLDVALQYLRGVRVHVEQTLTERVRGADVLIAGPPWDSLEDQLARMAPDPILFLLDATAACPRVTAERHGDDRLVVLAIQSSDQPRRLDWTLAAPGVFRGVLDLRARSLTNAMQVAAAHALAGLADTSAQPARILPNPTTGHVARVVAEAIRRTGRTRARTGW